MNVSVLQRFLPFVLLLCLAAQLSAQCTAVINPGTIAPATQTICSGDTPALLSSSADASATGVTAFDYLWMQSINASPLGSGTYTVIPGATGADYQPGALTRTTYFVRCVREAGCGPDYPYETNVVSVIVEPLPLAQFEFALPQADVNQPVTFSAVAVPNATYSFTFQDGSPATASGRLVNTQFTSGGVKTVTLTVTNTITGCSTTISRQILINAVLPVEWNYYRSKLVDTNVHVEWSTALETNADRFEIERSADGRRFVYLGEVAAAGNSSTEVRYHFVDERPAAGTYYYRLRQIDTDGAYELTPVMPVRITGKADTFTVGPNPVTEQLHVYTPGEDARTLELVEMGSGRVLRRVALEAGSARYTLPVIDLAEGLYALRLIGNGRVLTQTFTKIK